MKTKTSASRLISILLAIAMLLGLFAALPLTAHATSTDNTIDLNENWFGNVDRNTFWATWEYKQSTHTILVHSNVTIIGAVTGAANVLTLHIESGATVVWKANYTGASSDLYLLNLSGSGMFEMAAGSIINEGGASHSHLISTGANTGIKVSGGTLKAYNCAIWTNAPVAVSGGTLSVEYGDANGAIVATGPNAKVTVSGGTVKAATSSNAIVGNSPVTVSGGTVSAENGYAISSAANITVSGGAVSATSTKHTISMSGSGVITVSGSGTVKNTGSGDAISGINADVQVKGGTVSANTGTAVNAYTVTVSGGTVSAAGAKSTISGLTADVTGGKVEATGIGNAIEAKAVEVNGGVVSAKNGYAVAVSDPGNLTVSGGFVFAYGTNITGNNNVIKMTTGTPAISGNAVLCAWNKPSGAPTYIEGTTTNLTVSAGASATWGKSGSQNGISYAKNTNTGFFPISGIVVNAATAAQYNITFKYDNGESDWVQTVNEGDQADAPMEPVKEGFFFAGWYTDAGFMNRYDFNIPVMADVTLYAKWTVDPASPSDDPAAPGNPGDENGGFNWLWILLIVLAVVAVGGGIVFLALRNKEKKEGATQQDDSDPQQNISPELCTNCSAQLQIGAQFCTECGAQTGAAQPEKSDDRSKEDKK